MTDSDILRAGWLGDLPGDFADSFVAIGRWVRLERGQIVYGNGQEGTYIYGIARGTARMHIAMNEHEQRMGHIIGPGFWFGDAEFVAGVPRIMEVDAATDLLLLRVMLSDFRQLARDYPDAWRWIALLVVQHMFISIGAADDLMLGDARKRLAAVILRFGGYRLGHQASPPINNLPTTQQELAAAANLSRASAGRILREMEDKGEISIKYGALRIRDAGALAARLL